MVRKGLTALWPTCVCLLFHASTSFAAIDVVRYSSDAINLHGNWTRVADATAAGRQLLASAAYGWSVPDAPLAAPLDYFEFTFTAPANTAHHVWFRVRAGAASKWNASAWVQFSDALDAMSGVPVYGIGSTTGLLINGQSCSGCLLSGRG